MSAEWGQSIYENKFILYSYSVSRNFSFDFRLVIKEEKILKGSLDSIPSPSVKIQIMSGKLSMRYEGKNLLGLSTNF